MMHRLVIVFDVLSKSVLKSVLCFSDAPDKKG